MNDNNEMFNEEKERAAFEAWASKEGEWKVFIQRNSEGDYELASTFHEWEGWKARARAGARELSNAAILGIGDEYGLFDIQDGGHISILHYLASVRAILAKRGE